MKSKKDSWDKAVENVGRYWEPDTVGKVIRTKNLTRWQRFYLRWFKRFTVKELYVWTSTTWSQKVMMSYDNPLRHDNTRLSDELKRKISRIYQLTNGWTISPDDKKYLRRGPLISEDGRVLEVTAHGWLGGVVLWLEKYGRITNFLSFLLGLASFILGLMSFIWVFF